MKEIPTDPNMSILYFEHYICKRCRSASTMDWRGRMEAVTIFTLLLLCYVDSQGESPGCPYEGQLDVRQVDPFVFVGGISPLCCHPAEIDNSGAVSSLSWAPEDFNLVFSCSNNSGLIIDHPVQTVLSRQRGENHHRSGSFDKRDICVDVMATNLTQDVSCKCQVQGKPDCQATREFTVDISPPAKLQINCLTYGNDNVTCRSENLPEFLQTDRVSSRISWKQVDPSGWSSATRSKPCPSPDTCVLTYNDGMMFGLPLTFSIFIDLHYRTGLYGGQNASSEWLKYAIDSRVITEPLRANIVNSTNTTIRLMWQKQYMYFGDKVVQIEYQTNNDAEFPFVHFVPELMDFTTAPMEFTLTNLHPSTTYVIKLKSRLSQSDMWSRPVHLSATTL